MDGLRATIIVPSLVGTMETTASNMAVCSSKFDFLSDVISEKLTVAAREIFAALVKTVTDYERELLNELRRIIPTKPDPEVTEKELKDDEMVCEAKGGGASAEEEEHESNLRVVDTWSMSVPAFTKEEKWEDVHFEVERK
ncbi:hypothetical protein OJAV_G00185300 [Oryzias javanicus]|uniref:Uncharacterized protein n=1 Tax=Oryzias javanicus TaxID=123683 RepID=A0A3S2MJK3_ORYJA|nr:hypothetical protein OJAV_G00185300 [Oryzias javanicus]